MRSALAVLLAVPFAALAQSSEPAPQPAAQPPVAERAPLKLKLDNPSSWATQAPAAEKEQPGNLPGLGNDARPMPTTPAATPNRTSPYPSEPKAGY